MWYLLYNGFASIFIRQTKVIVKTSLNRALFIIMNPKPSDLFMGRLKTNKSWRAEPVSVAIDLDDL